MTLDEAIAKAKADGDVQLAEWLRQARGADAAARWYTEKLRDASRTIRKLLDENSKLMGQLERRKCKLVREHFEASGANYRLVCSECHHVVWDGWQEKPRYCAFCGSMFGGKE